MIRVLVADDHAVVREGLRLILSKAPDVEATGEAATGAEVLEKVADDGYDVVVLDITMPGISGLDVLSRLKEKRPDLPVIVLSMHKEKDYAVRVLKAGAAGYLAKEAAPRHLLEAVYTAARGEQYITPEVGRILAARLTNEVHRPLHERLSAREFEVMRRIAVGETQSEIAGALAISPKTVSTYRARILEKLGMRNDVDLARYALLHDLIE